MLPRTPWPEAADAIRSIEFGFEIIVASAESENELEPALAVVAEQHAAAVMVASDLFLSSRREYIALLALRHSLQPISNDRIGVVAGQLVSYGSSSEEMYQLAGAYVGRILKGEKPADLPVMQPTKFELAINLRTARTLGLEVPPILLTRADQVIE
jgi:putative tryptophan/tyrosine transport system substrate-binding protein